MVSYSKKLQYSAFKNTHAELNQLLKYSRMANGSLKTWDFKTYNDNTKGFDKYFLPYLDIAKDCGVAANDDCFADSYKDMKNAAYTIPATYRKVFLTNKTSLAYGQNNTCITDDGDPASTTADHPHACITFLVDINGKDKPNRMGRDLFEFKVYQFYDIVNPSGTFNEQYDTANRVWSPETTANRNSNCSSAGVGNYCGAKLVEDGKMDY